MSDFSLFLDLSDPEAFGIGTMPDTDTTYNTDLMFTSTSDSTSACGGTSRPIPPGLEIPDSWHRADDHLVCGPRSWEPKFTDESDVETRTGKDIEDFTPEELQKHKDLKGFGVHIYR